MSSNRSRDVDAAAAELRAAGVDVDAFLHRARQRRDGVTTAIVWTSGTFDPPSDGEYLVLGSRYSEVPVVGYWDTSDQPQWEVGSMCWRACRPFAWAPIPDWRALDLPGDGSMS